MDIQSLVANASCGANKGRRRDADAFFNIVLLLCSMGVPSLFTCVICNAAVLERADEDGGTVAQNASTDTGTFVSAIQMHTAIDLRLATIVPVLLNYMLLESLCERNIINRNKGRMLFVTTKFTLGD